MTGRPIPPPRNAPRRPLKLSVWSLLAPVALVIVVIFVFNAIGKSCAVRDCPSNAKSTTTTATAKIPTNKRHRVKPNETAGNIAKLYGLTVDDLAACNPKVADLYTLQVGQVLTVNPKRCAGLGDDTL